MEKAIKKYSKMFSRFISGRSLDCAPDLVREYPEKLRALYASDQYAEHNVYPTMNGGRSTSMV